MFRELSAIVIPTNRNLLPFLVGLSAANERESLFGDSPVSYLGSLMSRERTQERFGLPLRPFLYTLDQIADFLSISERTLKISFIYFDGVHTGKPPQSKIVAHNITPDSENPVWRVSEHEIVRWLKHVGFRVYDASVVRSRGK